MVVSVVEDEGQDWKLEDLEEHFVKLSRLFTKDLNLQDDLMQEMRIAAWAARGEGESKQIAMRRARKAARNYEGHFSHRRRKHREVPIGGLQDLERASARILQHE